MGGGGGGGGRLDARRRGQGFATARIPASWRSRTRRPQHPERTGHLWLQHTLGILLSALPGTPLRPVPTPTPGGLELRDAAAESLATRKEASKRKAFEHGLARKSKGGGRPKRCSAPACSENGHGSGVKQERLAVWACDARIRHVACRTAFSGKPLPQGWPARAQSQSGLWASRRRTFAKRPPGEAHPGNASAPAP